MANSGKVWLRELQSYSEFVFCSKPTAYVTVTHSFSGFAEAIADIVAEAVESAGLNGQIVLAGHSAAGAYLPVISSHLDRQVLAYIFVDARLPRFDASLADQDSPEERDALLAMAEAGRLPPWSEWFGEEVLRGVLPQDELRQAFMAELQPRLICSQG